uniref:FYVE-type domain-containing protein n=1 Tax=Globisporangium ultimum (strain ATCC 200006 / CBS 805.95 / DAOM BR144) TaxID=431595 RepID=K3WXE5_GLOUD
MNAKRPVSVKFPLPKSYFDHGALPPQQQAQYKALARARVESVLQAQREFVHVHGRDVNAAQWKLLKKKKDMRIYRRRASNGDVLVDKHQEQISSQPSMLGVGTMDGTLEDLIYGTYDKSYEEMKTTMAFVDIYTQDCNVLHTLELATAEDPFHYVGLKWTVSQLPGKLLVKPRDWCYLEAMGIETDSDGRRYGYTIVHSVEVPSCPPFDQRVIVRGKGSLSFIYREAGPGRVEIFAQGLFDPAGDLIQYFSVIMTTEIFSGQAMTVRCAEAKKLTVLALQNYHKSQERQLQKSCYLCVKSGRMLFSSLKMCAICGVTACDKCRVKRTVFLGPNHSVCDVTCCQSCLLAAKNMDVRPAESSFSMANQEAPADWITHNTGNSSLDDDLSTASDQSANSTTKKSRVLAPVGKRGSITFTASDADADDETQLANLEEADLEKLIETMIDQRLNDPTTSSRSARTSKSRAESLQIEFERGSNVATPPIVSPPVAMSAPPAAAEAAAASEQVTLFQKMLELQNAASQAYAITQANEEIMRSLK